MSIQNFKVSRWFIHALLASLLMLALSHRTSAQTPSGYVRASQILELSRYLASTEGAPDAYSRALNAAFGSAHQSDIKIRAYEENPKFVYAVASMDLNRAKNLPAATKEADSHWVRRFIALNSSVFLIEDEFENPAEFEAAHEGLIFATAPKISGGSAESAGPSGKITSEVLYPGASTYKVAHHPGGGEPANYVLEVVPHEKTGATRLLQVLEVGSDSEKSGEHIELKAITEDWRFTATVGNTTFDLTLPPPAHGAGNVSVSNAEGKTLVEMRPFPSGILPHGPEGDRLLDLWDSDYRRPQPALWDIGRPADELQKVINSGKIARCRVVDMCCGSGTDAIYLASKGFDVTGIDVAPTALGLAMEKARNAKVSVHWMVADILAPPDLMPFDFIYDRGCYHVVRDQNLNAYMETVRRFSRPGTQFLLLASRRDDVPGGEGVGVSEEELRFDFLPLFDVEWLREIVLESTRPGMGPPGWSALMKRNSAP